MYAQLGNIVFETREQKVPDEKTREKIFLGFFGFNDFSKSTSVSYAEHKPLTGKPLLQATGLNLDELSFSMRFHISFCNPVKELNTLKNAMDTFEILPLLMGNGRKEGDFVIMSINSVVEDADARGNIFSYVVNCTLKEYIIPDRLKAEQENYRLRAVAVGNIIPMAKPKVNPPTPPEHIARNVSAINNNTRVINNTVEQKGGLTSVINLNAIKKSAESIKEYCTDIRDKYEEIKGSVNDNEVLKQIKETSGAVLDAANQVRNTLLLPDDFILSAKALTQRVKDLKTVARPIVLNSSYRPPQLTKVIQHTTKEGERWDTIALRNYGSAGFMNRIIEANPGISRNATFSAGTVLNIPIIERTEVKTDAEKLPPWRRP